MPKKLQKDVLDFTKGITITSIGSGVITSAGGSAAPMATMASYFPVMGGMIGGFGVMRMLKTKKRRR